MREPLDLEHRDLLRLITGCIDATKNIEAEELDLQKVEAFKRVIKEIGENIECSPVNSLLSDLISVGLKPIPDLRYYELIGLTMTKGRDFQPNIFSDRNLRERESI